MEDRQQEVLNKLDSIEKQLMELRKEIFEMPDEKTYPPGFDPDGNFTVCFNDDESIKYGWYVEEISFLTPGRNTYHRSGGSFTTREQAEKKAAGLNAYRELVGELNNHDPQYADRRKVSFIHVHLGPQFLMVPVPVIEKLGEPKIELALEWGM